MRAQRSVRRISSLSITLSSLVAAFVLAALIAPTDVTAFEGQALHPLPAVRGARESSGRAIGERSRHVASALRPQLGRVGAWVRARRHRASKHLSERPLSGRQVEEQAPRRGKRALASALALLIGAPAVPAHAQQLGWDQPGVYAKGADPLSRSQEMA
jgi:hypothetical protein